MTTYVTSSSGSGQDTCGSGNEMVDQVAGIIGAIDEDNARVQALACINRIVGRLNKREFRFTKTTPSAITLANGTQTYSLDSAFSRPSYARLIDSSSKPYLDLLYEDDADLTHWIEPQTATGIPYYYYLRNSFGDGLIGLYPVPDTSTASLYRLIVEYYGRISTFTDDSSTISIPEQVCDVIVAGGQWLLLSERDRGNINAISSKRSEFMELEQMLVAWDKRNPDARDRFRIGRTRTQFGTMYIKVT